MKSFRLVDSKYPVQITEKCIVAYSKPSARCPACLRFGKPRQGVGFEGEFRCANCDITWVPEDSYLLIVTEK